MYKNYVLKVKSKLQQNVTGFTIKLYCVLINKEKIHRYAKTETL